MPLNDRNKLNRIEELKSKLFSKNYQPNPEHHGTYAHMNKVNVPDSWSDAKKGGTGFLNYQEKFFMKTSRFKKFFIFSISFFVLTLGYASYVFFFAGNTVSNDNIDISILGNTFTAGGEELSLVIGITNRNNSSLDLVDLVVEYPKGGTTGLPSDMERLRESLGSIPAGSVRNENVKLVLYGEQGSVRPIKVSIEYRVAGSNAIFVKEKPYEVSISSTPINLLIDAPATVSPNQNITLNVKSILNATKAVPNVMLKVEYPVGFQFISSVPEPSISNNIWTMGDFAPGVERNIAISGRMIDVFDGEEKSFRVSSGSQSASDKFAIGTVFNSLTHTVMVKKPFIEASLSINGTYQREYATDSQTPVQGTINWSNNLDTKVNDVEIRAKISGNAFEEKTVSADQGRYDSLQKTIIWDKFSQSQLAEINPGDFGFVEFSISPIPVYSPAGGILKDPSIYVEVSISGKQQIEGYEPQELNNSESKLIKVTSDLGLATKALYSSGPFPNTGPIPPKVETETTYTITWSISNTANNISKAEVRAILPPWVRFMGAIAPAGENLVYNSSSREMVWNIGRIPKGTGITTAGREASFQIGLTPLFSQAGSVPVLVNDAVLTGHDDFANVDVRETKPALRTQLTGEAQFPAGGGVVTQ